MGVPNSEVGYTSAMPRREDHEVHKDMWGIGRKKVLNASTWFALTATESKVSTRPRNPYSIHHGSESFLRS